MEFLIVCFPVKVSTVDQIIKIMTVKEGIDKVKWVETKIYCSNWITHIFFEI